MKLPSPINSSLTKLYRLPLSVTNLLQDFIAAFLDECNSFLTDFPSSSLLFLLSNLQTTSFFPLPNLQPFQTSILKVLLLPSYSSVHTISWFLIAYYAAGHSRYSSIPVSIDTHPELCHTIHIFLAISCFLRFFFFTRSHLLINMLFSPTFLFISLNLNFSMVTPVLIGF